MPTSLVSLCLGWKLLVFYTLGVEFLEHAPLIRRPAAATEKPSNSKKIKIFLPSIPYALPLCNCLN